MKDKTKEQYIMKKMTTAEWVGFFKGQAISTIDNMIQELKEQLLWEDSAVFTPLYTKNEKKNIIYALEKLLDEKLGNIF